MAFKPQFMKKLITILGDDMNFLCKLNVILIMSNLYNHIRRVDHFWFGGRIFLPNGGWHWKMLFQQNFPITLNIFRGLCSSDSRIRRFSAESLYFILLSYEYSAFSSCSVSQTILSNKSSYLQELFFLNCRLIHRLFGWQPQWQSGKDLDSRPRCWGTIPPSMIQNIRCYWSIALLKNKISETKCFFNWL